MQEDNRRTAPQSHRNGAKIDFNGRRYIFTLFDIKTSQKGNITSVLHDVNILLRQTEVEKPFVGHKHLVDVKEIISKKV